MHTCSSFIILIPYFTSIDSSRRGGRLERITSSPHSIISSHIAEEMEQQGGKWSMDDLRAMIQYELKRALAGLIPHLVVEMAPTATTIPPASTVVIPFFIKTQPANNDNIGRQPLDIAINIPTVENNIVERAKKESLELV